MSHLLWVVSLWEPLHRRAGEQESAARNLWIPSEGLAEVCVPVDAWTGLPTLPGSRGSPTRMLLEQSMDSRTTVPRLTAGPTTDSWGAEGSSLGSLCALVSLSLKRRDYLVSHGLLCGLNEPTWDCEH